MPSKDLYSHFSYVPNSIEKKRSIFSRPFTWKGTFDAGKLNVVFVDQNIVPGDTVTLDTSCVVRSATPYAPVMDNAQLELFWFFVPNRLLWTHFEEYMGENKTSYWAPSVEYTKPQMLYNVSDANVQSSFVGGFIDQVGLPLNITGDNYLSVSALPIRAYIKIWNDWFRDQNVQSPLVEQDGDSNLSYFQYLGNSESTSACLLNVCKHHDYFTSALPGPLKNNSPVKLPMTGQAPVVADNAAFHSTGDNLAFGTTQSSGFAPGGVYGLSHTNGSSSNILNMLSTKSVDSGSQLVNLNNTNLVADLTNATAATINDLRNAIVVQQYYEALARGGSRYIEQNKEFFGVNSGDARLQRPELIGGRSIPININQVLQTALSSDDKGVGNTGAYSLTADKSNSLTFSAKEHGILMGLMCIRTSKTYSQGIEKQWLRKTRLEEYNPLFANIGEQPILNKEIYATGSSSDDEVFGYQEAFADMRYTVDHVVGYMRPNVNESLAVWNYSENFDSTPVLNSTFMQESKANVARTLQVTGGKANQYIGDFFFSARYTRVMPLYSVPGLKRI